MSKENEKYGILLESSDCCHVPMLNVLSVDVGCGKGGWGCLETLYSVSASYTDSLADRLLRDTHAAQYRYTVYPRYSVVHSKVMSRAPKLSSGGKSKLSMTVNDQLAVQSVCHLYESMLARAPRPNGKHGHMTKAELDWSGMSIG